MKTREDFIATFKDWMAGNLALGKGEVRRTLAKHVLTADDCGEVIHTLADTSTTILGKLYDYLNPPPPPKKAA